MKEKTKKIIYTIGLVIFCLLWIIVLVGCNDLSLFKLIVVLFISIILTIVITVLLFILKVKLNNKDKFVKILNKIILSLLGLIFCIIILDIALNIINHKIIIQIIAFIGLTISQFLYLQDQDYNKNIVNHTLLLFMLLQFITVSNIINIIFF